MTFSLERRWPLWLGAILVLAVLLRLGYSFGVARGLLDLQPQLEANDGYGLIAENLYAGNGYRFAPDKLPTAMRAPVYPLMLWGTFEVFGVNYAVIQVLQALLGALTCYLVFLLGRWVLSIEVGLIAALLCAFYPNAIIYSSRIYAENAYYPLFVGFAYLLCRISLTPPTLLQTTGVPLAIASRTASPSSSTHATSRP